MGHITRTSNRKIAGQIVIRYDIQYDNERRAGVDRRSFVLFEKGNLADVHAPTAHFITNLPRSLLLCPSFYHCSPLCTAIT